MEIEEQLKKALEELRKNKERKFEQTVDLIINLQKFDLRRNSVNVLVSLPHKIKDKKIAAFLETKNKIIDTITKDEFKKYSDKNEVKKLVKKYDFFISQANLMANVATTFGRFLGPAGKMPSPQSGVLINANEKSINDVIEKINTSERIRTKDSSVKLAIGKEKMPDNEIIENVMVVYNTLIKNLPRGKENVKNIELKFTMTKPVKINVR